MVLRGCVSSSELEEQQRKFLRFELDRESASAGGENMSRLVHVDVERERLRRCGGGVVDKGVVLKFCAATAGDKKRIPWRSLLRCCGGRAFDGKRDLSVRRCDMSFGACKIGEILCTTRLLGEQGSEREIGNKDGVLGCCGLCVGAERRLDFCEQRAALGKEKGHKGRLRGWRKMSLRSLYFLLRCACTVLSPATFFFRLARQGQR